MEQTQKKYETKLIKRTKQISRARRRRALLIMILSLNIGSVAEWFKALVSKTSDGVIYPLVQIQPFPLK